VPAGGELAVEASFHRGSRRFRGFGLTAAFASQRGVTVFPYGGFSHATPCQSRDGLSWSTVK